MKKGKRLSRAEGLEVLKRAYRLIKEGRESAMCIAIKMAADETGVDDERSRSIELIPELRMFKPIGKNINSFWFHYSEIDTRLYILHTLIDIYNGTDSPDIVERIARKIRSVF